MEKKKQHLVTEEISAAQMEHLLPDEELSSDKRATKPPSIANNGLTDKQRRQAIVAVEQIFVGTVIDSRYEIKKCLGIGAMGSVFLANHQRLNKLFALKMVNLDLAQSSEFVARFEREANACSRLNHPNCISVTDFGQTAAGQLYLVMEFVDGVSLNDYVNQHSVSISDAIEFTRQILVGLEHAHGKGLIHRDIKLENIYLCQQDTDNMLVKILDFGMAKSPTQAPENVNITQQGVVLGTPHYMAPEQLRGHEVDERCDLYAVGITLFRMITGQLVFTGETTIDILGAKLNSPAPSLKEVSGKNYPESLESFLNKALVRNPNHRYSSATEMLAALEHTAQNLHVERPTEATVHLSPVQDAVVSSPAPQQPHLTESGKEELAQPVPVPRPTIETRPSIQTHRSLFSSFSYTITALFDHVIDDTVYWYTCGRNPRQANWKHRIRNLFTNRIGKLVFARFILTTALLVALGVVAKIYLFTPHQNPTHSTDTLVSQKKDNLSPMPPQQASSLPNAASVSKPPKKTPSSSPKAILQSQPSPSSSPTDSQANVSKPIAPIAPIASMVPPANDQDNPALFQAKVYIEQQKCWFAKKEIHNYLKSENSPSAQAHYLLGRAHMCLNKPKDALKAYKTAIEMDNRYRTDEIIATDSKKMISLPKARTASLNFMTTVLNQAALPTLVHFAGHHQNKEVRHHCRTHVEKLGALEHVNMTASLEWDLNQTGSCKAKRKIVDELVQIGTTRAKQVLIRARDAQTRVGVFRKKYVHECVRNYIITKIQSFRNNDKFNPLE